MREGSVTLPDGRALGYAEYGDPRGRPILQFHGLPGGRSYDLEGEALAAAGARSITLERPGIGLSDPKSGRTLADWPADVEAFADAMGFERYAVVGTSAGGPYALATGLALPDRVTAVGLQCAMGPAFDHPEQDGGLPAPLQALLPFARQDRDAAIPLVHQILGAERGNWLADPDGFFDQWLLTWPENDRPLFRQFEGRWRHNLEATQRIEGAYPDDVIIVFGPWGLDLAAMRVPVRAWHGTDDGAAPLGLVQEVVKLTGGEVVTYEGEGHYLDRTHHAEWIDWLLQPN
jgi:pimeloyl-ACP methyl ester carboxylesterase